MSDDTQTTAPAESTPKPDKAALFQDYRTKSGELAAARSVIADLEGATSQAIGQIVTHYGAGPWLLHGKEGPRTFFRGKANKDGTTTYYARTEADKPAEEV